jgi:tetratricopeptide (TPR) repeat protein
MGERSNRSKGRPAQHALDAKIERWIPVALAALTLAVFAQVRTHDFVNLDDYTYVLENPNLLDGPGLDAAIGAFARPYEHNWIPLTWISLQIDHAFYGREAAGYLLTNVALHLASALVLFYALLYMTGAVWRSAFVAFVFAIHPLHVESVAWVSERKDVLSGLFWMLALWAHAHYARAASVRRWVLVAACLALGLLAKPMLVTLPFVLLLLDWWPLARLGAAHAGGARRAVLEKLPLLAFALAAGGVTYAVQQSTGAISPLEEIPLGARVTNALVTYAVYIGKSLWPTDLAAFYPYPSQPLIMGAGASALLLTAISAVTLRLAHSAPYLLTGWLWYLVSLVPVIGLVQVGLQARADRYTYLPQIGLSIALAWGAAQLFSGSRAGRRALAAAGSSTVAALAAAAFLQVGHWQDTTHLYTRALAVTQDNFVAHRGLADEQLKRGLLEEALHNYRAAAQIRPNWAEAELGIADVWLEQGEISRPLAVYRRWAERKPQDPRPVGSMGLALLRAGRFDEAQAPLERALALDPYAAEAQAGIAVVAERRGDLRSALEGYRRALRLDPSLHTAANNLAWGLATSSDPELRDAEQAVRIAERAQRAAPRPDPALLDTLAAAYAAQGRFEEALRTAQHASELARRGGANTLAREIDARAALYSAGRPYRTAR